MEGTLKGNVHVDQSTIAAAPYSATEEPTMHPKLVVAILVATAVAGFAQAQVPHPVVAAARWVVEIISSDPAKIEIYCALGKLGEQIEDANEAKDKKTANVLTEKMRGLEEYLSLMYGLQTIDPESDDGVEIEALSSPLDRSRAQE